MKNIKKIALIIMSLTLLTACSNNKVNEKTKLQEAMKKSNAENNNEPKAAVPSDIKESSGIVNKVDFEEVKVQDLKPSVKNIFEYKKNYRGYSNFKDEDGYWYLGIFSGKKNTGGYTIKVLHVEGIEGKTEIIVQENSPKSSDYVTQAITYPYTVIHSLL